MRPVLLRIPTPWGDVPIFSFGIMLVLAFLIGTWLAARRARREGVPPEAMWDIAIYVFFGGVVGARILHMILFPQPGNLWQQMVRFVKIWEGGLVFYGSLIGGGIGFILAHMAIMRRLGIRTWQVADLITPSLALGICFGRIGCFLNGCCFGNVADPSVPAWLTVRFPPLSMPHRALAERGYQTLFGFALASPQDTQRDARTVVLVEPDSPAAKAGLQAGDVILEVNGQPIDNGDVLRQHLNQLRLQASGPHAAIPDLHLALTVMRQGSVLRPDSTDGVAPFRPPWSLPLYPTQLISALDGLVLYGLLTLYYPLRRRYGEIFAAFLATYAVSRFFIEQIRSDTPRLWAGMTFSQLVSVAILITAVLFWLALYRWGEKPAQELCSCQPVSTSVP
ncbi:MAG: prolipoprotein diacylglyceryl transferase [Gemmatales bacterium]|nr:prolipoprotein diacylglyceryl transferase [Gemmatales bacterium]MDW7993810.1 prolipoprotein diacylglyceryl transferase [Gemmatales bacterium]